MIEQGQTNWETFGGEFRSYVYGRVRSEAPLTEKIGCKEDAETKVKKD